MKSDKVKYKNRVREYSIRLIKILAWIVGGVVLLLTFLWLLFNWPVNDRGQTVNLGITYSDRYAENLGLDPRQTYIDILDEFNIQKLRLPVYWDRVEPSPGQYDFSELDWQLAEAAKRNVEVILVIGQKVPRWPECFVPSWVKDDTTRKEALLGLLEIIVKRYKNHPVVKVWQVENEPFLPFGEGCPPLDTDLLDKEITLVKSLDTRPVLLTDSGELSIWIPAAARGDMFGTTLYRDLWAKHLERYITYPVGPNFFRVKEWFVRMFTHQEQFIVVELQAEPWTSQWITDASLEEQFLTMNERKLVENVEYAKLVGFSDIYLWGAEWWYWLKVKKSYPAVWETARQLFLQSKNN